MGCLLAVGELRVKVLDDLQPVEVGVVS